MNSPDSRPTDEQLAALLAAADRAAPPPDSAALVRLREQSSEAFRAAAPAGVRFAVLPSLHWALAAAAMLVMGIVLAQLVARVRWGDPAPEQRFVVSGTLTDDGRIGQVTDAQGVVGIKPVQYERWSPVQPRLVLKPGDWLRTDARGANAVAVKLVNSAGVIIGPHSTVELVKPAEIHLLEGEVEITAPADTAVELHGPDRQTVTVRGQRLVRVEKDKLVRIDKDPPWLQGFKGATANESLGSLVAVVDGRNVPLTVGYHHVTVDIRDQIARTVIEESFVNRTPNVLEGVFHFPLPQDASISGFGMWIGDQLVEADVVEKQRAREIYETILRERRDPGLLEWTGGNIFKARVFPIPGHSEKRIKISYTQVLPLRGNHYRYSYGLQSELLKQHPLRDLSIDVTINSAAPLKSVSSPTHPARVRATEHSGRVEFTAQEYTPTRDFEAVVEVEGRRSDVVIIPHRRGDDGYFMVQLTPPGAAGDWDRPLIPDGEPLRLLLLADTSASMDKSQRATQSAVLASLLDALTPKDTVNLATCDVNCDWVFEKPVAATPANLATIRQAVAARTSLGWTDLDKAFASALAMSDMGTHVVYLGDGIVTTGDADPVAFAKRLHRLYEGHAGTFHAIACGSSYEPAVLKAIAALGGGSLRHVSGEQGPQAIACELLSEIAAPALRDLKVTFTGLRTARVYPEVLPNVAAGAQQILLGRYLPEGKDQAGEIVVTGTLGGKPVRYTSKVSLKDAEQGNSFIPRLWARMHLDKLLEQGTSEAIQQEIIALSEEYQIITPYTSLLVLESDADRERFAVKRRFQMRDGERFFAAGRDNAAFELKQKQMRQAGDYRTALRRQVLADMLKLGRDVESRYAAIPWGAARNMGGMTLTGLGALGFGGGLGGFGGGGVGIGGGGVGIGGGGGGLGGWGYGGPFFGLSLGMTPDVQGLADRLADADERERNLKDTPGRDWDRLMGGSMTDYVSTQGFLHGEARATSRMTAGSADLDSIMQAGEVPALMPRFMRIFAPDSESEPLEDAQTGDNYQPGPLQWLANLFPSLRPAAAEAKQPTTAWPAEALALSRSLLRVDKLAQRPGGIVVNRQAETFRGGYGQLAYRSNSMALVAPTTWLVRTIPADGPVTVSWCDAKEYGAYSAAYLLGRVRTATPSDLSRPPLDLDDYSVTPLHVVNADLTPKVEAIAPNRALLILTSVDNPGHEVRFLIDTARHVVLSREQRAKGQVTSTTRYGDFTEVGGSWWTQRVETVDAKGTRTGLTTLTVADLPADEFAKRMALERAGAEKVLFLRQPLPKVAAAKAAAAAGKATFDDEAVLTMHFAASQQWTKANEHLQQCERLAAGKAGMRRLTDSYLFASRRHEEWRQRLFIAAAALRDTTDPDVRANELYLAENLVGRAQNVLQADEALAVLDALENVYRRQPADLQALKSWRHRRAILLKQAGQNDRVLAILKEQASDDPHDAPVQVQYIQVLAGAGDFEAAHAWLNRVLVPDAKWDNEEENTLRGAYFGLLRQQGRFRELADSLATRVSRDPDSESIYGQYLSALVRSNQSALAETLAAQWLREGQASQPPPAVAARLDAALALALGRLNDFHNNRFDERWHAPLAQAVPYFVRHDEHIQRAATILQHQRFQASDAGREARKTLAGMLLQDCGALSPMQLNHIEGWVESGPAWDRDFWAKLATGVRQRWDAEQRPTDKDALSQPLLYILNQLGPDEVLAFLRTQAKDGPEPYRQAYADHLFAFLLTQRWSAAVEDEAFSLLGTLASPEDPANEHFNLYTRVAALYRLTDTMFEARFQARMKAVEHPEKLTRVELQQKRAENRRLARQEFADRLRQEPAKHAKPLADWLVVERLWLDTLLERNLPECAEECWRFLTAAPAPAEGVPTIAQALDRMLRQRFLLTLEHLAARKGADPALVNRLLQYVDQQLTAKPDDGRWRAEKYRLLIALDRPRDLETELRRWTAGSDPDGRWRIALGYLLAEQGNVADAIQLFEAVEAADELNPAEYRSLADWYLVENRRDQHDKAQAAIYETASDDQLAQRIAFFHSARQNSNGHLPTQLDPEVLLVFKSLFEKSASPQNYLRDLQQFYQASRDFRLLSMLADGVIGHSAGKVYPFLRGMSNVLGEVRDEATADELVARIALVRASAKTAVDRRALDLLELFVERRAAEVQNQPGSRMDKALAALERAFRREWSPGEPRLMADFLVGLGNIAQPALAREQLRQLDALHRLAAAGTFDRLHIARRYAEILDASARRADATDLLAAALKELEAANRGVLPVSANAALTALISILESARHYDRGESLLLEQLKHPANNGQKHWLAQQLNQLYAQALQNNGDVSLGRGAAFYKALQAKLIADLATSDQNYRHQVVSNLLSVYRTARTLNFAVVDDLKAFVFRVLPPILNEQAVRYEGIVREVAETLHSLASPRDALAFLLDRIEGAPNWVRYTDQGGWRQFGPSLAHWRTEVKDLGELEPRLLAIMLAELRRDLRSRESRHREGYVGNSHFWSAKEADFAKVADEVLAERPRSSAAVEYIAQYLFDGLQRPARAIEVLYAAHERKVLAESGRWQLVRFLHHEQRYTDIILLLAPLVEAQPENLNYRTTLMHAYFRTGRRAELLAFLKQTDAFFHEKDRWTEEALADLADSCLQNELFAQAADYYEELIARHQRSQPRRGVDSGTLTNCYANAARAYAGMGKTREAVDKAAGAVVSWPADHGDRQRALDAVVQVLASAPDLAAYVAEFDKEKLQSAIIRKAIGQAYVQKDEPARAIPQFQLAAELQPNDAETYQALIDCYDRVGDNEAAVRQLLQAVELSRRDVRLYEQLGQRLTDLRQPAEAERAYTSMVEMLPNESEGHALLAEVREKQNRWPDAIAHWERVAQIRALEPTGLLKLAAAQIHEKSWDQAAATLRRLRRQSWPQHFGDVQQQVRELEKQIERQRESQAGMANAMIDAISIANRYHFSR